MIVPTYRDHERLAACLGSLCAQHTSAEFEIIVSASADRAEDLPDVAAGAPVRVVTHVPRRLPGAARNAAAEIATGDVLLFADADVVVPPTWIDDFLGAWDGRTALAGAVRNGHPRSVTGTADYLCEFLDFTPRRRAESTWHGVTCNLLVPRRLWEEFGPFADVIGGEDTAFTHGLARAGLLRFSPSVEVEHYGRTGVRSVLAHQYQLGRYQARLPTIGPHPWRVVLEHPALAPGAVLGRLGLMAVRVPRRASLTVTEVAYVTPMVVSGLVAWGAGLAGEGRRVRRNQTARAGPP